MALRTTGTPWPRPDRPGTLAPRKTGRCPTDRQLSKRRKHLPTAGERPAQRTLTPVASTRVTPTPRRACARSSCALAARQRVTVGAHVGCHDLRGFDRRYIAVVLNRLGGCIAVSVHMVI
ncbi:LamB/YcsF family protein [Streptomyces sp. NPDC048197]|uniref:LamB/YcsF family protein n=1 Tax=Streptomyces sp. NPDC048197 TaxID=3365511 RepID=UPI0037125862